MCLALLLEYLIHLAAEQHKLNGTRLSCTSFYLEKYVPVNHNKLTKIFCLDSLRIPLLQIVQ